MHVISSAWVASSRKAVRATAEHVVELDFALLPDCAVGQDGNRHAPGFAIVWKRRG